MTKRVENFIELLAKKSLNYHDFIHTAYDIDEIASIIEVKDLDDWKLLGLDIERDELGKVTLATRYKDISEQVFCIVDIETSGGIHNGQIIEIGAIKLLNSEEIGRFESYVWTDFVPQNISELTGIYVQDLQGAPNLKDVLEKFKLFLGDCVFVAHNVKFDYGFISETLQKLDMGFLLNRKICTIDLARRTIPSPKYGLETLKELLEISGTHHQALSDAQAAMEIFKHSLKMLPWSVQSVEDLITFSKTAPNLKIRQTLPKFE